MSSLTRREFVRQSLTLGTLAGAGPLLLSSGCHPTPAPYFPPSGLSRALSSPVLHLRAASLRPGRIDLIFFAGGQLRHKWLEVTSPGVHRWGPDETSLGEPLGEYEYPTPVVFEGKLWLFATSGVPRTVSFRVYDPATGWTDWVGMPGVSVPRVVGFNTGRGTVKIVGLDETRRVVTTELSTVFTTPQPWRVIPGYRGGGQHEWIDVAPLPGDAGGVLFGRMNTGTLVNTFSDSSEWGTIRSAPGDPSVGVTAYSDWISPIYFTHVRDGAGNETLRFIWTDSSNDEHHVDLGPNLSPPLVISQSPTADFYTRQLDLFTITRSGTDPARTALLWARVTPGDLIDRRISWHTLASDLSAGAEQLTPISWGPGRIDVFVTDAGGNIWHKWSDSRTTLGWQPAA
jgi:hypothetical protein